MTATITPAGGAAVDPVARSRSPTGQLPLGTVNVSDAGATATASLDTSSLVQGVHFVTATYSGDATYATSTTPMPVTVHVAEAPTTVTVDDASAQSVVGQTVVFTASITSPALGTTGTVQFADGGDPIGSGAVSGGQATFETSSLALGAHPITAIYEGDDNFVGGSSSNTLMQTIGQAATSTGVTCAHDPGLVGQSITYTATIAVATPGSGTPTGTASFSDGGIPIPGCQGLALSPAPPLVVTCAQAYDTTASQDVTASYSGDANFTASAGAMTENVSPVSTTITIVPSPAASTSGQSVTLTATVSPTSGTADPDGYRVVHAQRDAARHLRRDNDERRQLRQHAAHDSAHRVRLGVGVLRRQTRLPCQFVRQSDARHRDEGVDHARALGGRPTTSTPGTPTTLTANVFPSTGSGETGTVTFFENGERLGTSPVTNGQATLTVFDTLTNVALTADYSGDSNFTGSATPTPLVPGS